jgi:hypothetical protein
MARVKRSRPTHRRHRATVVAALVALGLAPVMAGCDSDDDGPFSPATSVPPVETGLTPSDGVTVTLEPGSNLPPGEDGGERDEESDMDVDGDGRGEGEDDGDG